MVLRITKVAVIEVACMSTEEHYLIVDSVGATDSGELGHGFKPPVSIYIPVRCVVYYSVQWDVKVEILEELLFLVDKDGRHESFPIGPGKYK